MRDREEPPPLIILDEASGYSFATGTHDLSPAFRRALDEQIVPAIAREADACRCDVLEVFGHTDGRRIAARRGRGGARSTRSPTASPPAASGV